MDAATASKLPGKGSPRNPLRGLRYGALSLLLVLAAALFYILAERTRADGGPPLLSLETGEGVAQRSLDLDLTRTRMGLPSLQVKAREAVTYRDGSTVLHDVEVNVFGDGEERTSISAPVAISGEGSSGGWSFRDGVVLTNDKGMRVEVPEITYRESPPELSGDGRVVFSSGSIEGSAHGLRYLVARRRLEFLRDVEIVTGDPGGAIQRIVSDSARLDPASNRITFLRYSTEGIDGQRLTGTSLEVAFQERGDVRIVRSIRSTLGFRAVLPEGGGGAPPGVATDRILTGETFEMSLGADGVVESARAEGGVRLSDGDPNRNPRTLSCEILEAAFDSGLARSLTASGEAHLRIPAAEDPRGEVTTVSAERIMVHLSREAGGGIEAVEAEERVTASNGDRMLEAPRIRYDVGEQRWRLEGSEESQARLVAGEASVEADRMEIDRAQELLLARGRVRTVYAEAEGEGGEPGRGRPDRAGISGLLGSEEGSLHAMSQNLVLRLREKKAHYTGGVRVWRGGGSIEAAEVRYSESDGILDAIGSVVARIPVEGATDPSSRTITVTSETLRYRRDDMDARFEGGAAARTGGLRLRAASMHATGTTLAGIRSLLAEGDVLMNQGTLRGEGDKLVGDLAADTFTLQGTNRLAMIQDQSNQQVAKGAVLTYERATGRIQIESESGGRTWITLRPTSGQGERGDPKPPR